MNGTPEKADEALATVVNGARRRPDGEIDGSTSYASGMGQEAFERAREQRPSDFLQIGMPFIRLPPKEGESDWRYSCPKLGDDGRCTIYETRPAVCRHFEPATAPLCVHFVSGIGLCAEQPSLDDSQRARNTDYEARIRDIMWPVNHPFRPILHEHARDIKGDERRKDIIHPAEHARAAAAQAAQAGSACCD